jgi:2-desacetyl-2-hydroxyethyl bacteriochlorophyllide A dehydrogenase
MTLRPRAAWITRPGAVELRELPDEPLGPAAVRVRTELSAISAGTELLFYRGQLEQGVAIDANLAWSKPLEYPLRYGYAAVGRVIALGAEVPADVLGARVFGFQPHAEQWVDSLASLIILPDSIPDERAVFLPNLETALSLAMDGAPGFGEQVAVLGQGVVGQLVSALLVRSGAERVVSIDPRADRLDCASALYAGAAGEPARFELQAAVDPALHDQFDLVYELSGDPAALNDAQLLARYEGRIVVGSWYGSKRCAVDLGTRAHRNRNRWLFSQVSRIDSQHAARFDAGRRLQTVLRWLERLPVERLITQRVPFERIDDAYRLLDRASEPCVQLVITYAPAQVES